MNLSQSNHQRQRYHNVIPQVLVADIFTTKFRTRHDRFYFATNAHLLLSFDRSTDQNLFIHIRIIAMYLGVPPKCYLII